MAHSPPLGLYVHWPFCLSKCPYCDFNSHVRASINADDYADALVREMKAIAQRLEKTSPLTSIFFGGGTPSLMPGDAVANIIKAAETEFGFESDIEITLEANPTSVDATRFHEYRAAGVNRVSLGVQALNDEDLKRLGRLHSVDEALRAVGLAQSIFPRMSFDLIYARPSHNLDDWQRELERALSQGCTHYSLYQLTFEEGTPFHQALSRGTMSELDVEHAAELYEFTQAKMEQAGLPAYEISNHSTTGEESRHNLIYWRYHDYVGIGPGAHGRLSRSDGKYATEIEKHPESWLRKVNEKGDGITRFETVSFEDQLTEALLMGLRLVEGVEWARFQHRISEQALSRCCSLGMVTRENGRLSVTKRGRLVLNALIKDLLT